MKNLLKFIPELERRLDVIFKKENMFLMGNSRGGMQMFLALARFPKIQNRVSKVVSLSGLLDLSQMMLDRRDMKEMFMNEFGLVENNEEDWISYRDPMRVVNKLRSDLPILIIQGAADIRVSLEVGYHMVAELEANGNPVVYWEVVDGDHCLKNYPDRMEIIADWLEQ